MPYFRFTVHLHGHGPGDVVEVAEEDVPSIIPLMRSGFLLPVHPLVGSDTPEKVPASAP